MELVALIIGVVAVLAGLAWLASRARRRGVVGSAITGAMAAYDEAYHPTAHDAHIEVVAQADRTIPKPSPEEQP